MSGKLISYELRERKNNVYQYIYFKKLFDLFIYLKNSNIISFKLSEIDRSQYDAIIVANEQ